MDFTSIHTSSANLAHRVDLFCWQGAPLNNDPDHPVQVLVNTGFVVGFCPSRRQPAWAAYRVAYADRDVDFDRPHLYYEDTRVDSAVRLTGSTFGSGYHVGHMAPNEAINRQFGRLAQMETFFMTNMSPQRGPLNTGVWLKLEKAILDIEDTPSQKDHVWVLIGPVFSDDPDTIEHSGKQVPLPESYFCITVDPHSYPFNTLSRVHLVCMIIPQNAPSSGTPSDHLVSLADVEDATKLTFFPGWARPRAAPGAPSPMATVHAPSEHRLLKAIEDL
ncbi:MAG: hypothetical protein GY906_29725 [bacterium]|nr:hypothetical protein [bacterium]